MPPTNSLHRLAQQSFVYSPVPTLIIDGTGRVAALNIACRTLFGAAVAGCARQTFDNVVTQLRPRLRGHLISVATKTSPITQASETLAQTSTQESCAEIGESSFDSESLGCVVLRTSEVPYLDQRTGYVAGRIISLELVHEDIRKQFEVVLERRWHHALMWQLYAVSYDRVLCELSFYREVVERHCAAMSHAAIETVLDIGAGTGNVAVALLEQGKRVTAVDIAMPMLQQLLDKLDETTSPRIVVIEDTAEWLPQLADASFDGVTALLAFFDMQQPHAALEEAIRVLRPGGMIIITDPRERFNVDELMAAAKNDLVMKGVFNRLRPDWERIQTVAPLIAQTIHEVHQSSVVARRPWHAEAIYKILHDRHFRDLRMEDSHLGNCATIWAIKPD